MTIGNYAAVKYFMHKDNSNKSIACHFESFYPAFSICFVQNSTCVISVDMQRKDIQQEAV